MKHSEYGRVGRKKGTRSWNTESSHGRVYSLCYSVDALLQLYVEQLIVLTSTPTLQMKALAGCRSILYSPLRKVDTVETIYIGSRHNIVNWL